MKFDLNDIHTALKRADVSPDKIDAAAKILQDIAEENRPDPADKQKRAKKEILGFVSEHPVTDQSEQTVYLVQVNENIPHDTVAATLAEVGKGYNEAVKNKKKRPKIEKFSDHFELLKPKLLKEKGIRVLTKEPIILIKYTN